MVMSTQRSEKRVRRRSRMPSRDFIKKIHQESLLVELSERVALEMERLGLTERELQEKLGVNEAYVQGVLSGFANITLRELADIFTCFDRLVSLKPIELGGVRKIKQQTHAIATIPVSEERLNLISKFINVNPSGRTSITIHFSTVDKSRHHDGWSKLEHPRVLSKSSSLVDDSWKRIEEDSTQEWSLIKC